MKGQQGMFQTDRKDLTISVAKDGNRKHMLLIIKDNDGQVVETLTMTNEYALQIANQIIELNQDVLSS